MENDLISREEVLKLIEDIKMNPEIPKNYGTLLDIIRGIRNMGVKALEKQIPQKPISHNGTNRADCPVCGAIVRGIKEPFGDWCSKCGQAIDWNE